MPSATPFWRRSARSAKPTVRPAEEVAEEAAREAEWQRFAEMGIVLIDRINECVVVGNKFVGRSFKLGDPAPHLEQSRVCFGFLGWV